MSERRVSARSSVLSFVVTAAVATAAAMGLLVLLDPRAQAFWVARIQEFIAAVRGLVGL
jgi:hypothetical protein